MIMRHLIHASAYLLAILTACAFAENTPNPQENADRSPHPAVDQIIYKGLIGNALDSVPMDSAQRVKLQQTNAVVSSTLSGRSLTTLTKLTNPVLLIGSIVWGLWAAANINSQIGGAPLPEMSAPASPIGQLAGAGEAISNANSESIGEVQRNTQSPESAAISGTSDSSSKEPLARTIKIWLPPPRY